MTEEEKTESTEETADDAAADEQPDAPEETEAAEEPAVEEAAPEEAPDPGEAAEEAPADEPAAEEAVEEPAAEAPAREPEEPEAVLTPKQLRRQRRSQHTGDVRPQRSPEERAAERSELRASSAAQRRRTRATTRSKRQPGQGTPPADRRPGAKKVRQGTVVSDKADKTITVQIEIVRRHPVYEKVVRRSTTIHAHDEGNEANAGDFVRVIESRPLSRTKRWRLVEVLEKAR